MSSSELVVHGRDGSPIVRLRSDDAANGQRLEVTSLGTGDVGFIDALMLEALTWSEAAELSAQSGEEPR